MMSDFDPIDSWFEKGFRVRRQAGAKAARSARQDSIRSCGSSRPADKGGVKFSANAKANNVRSILRKAPEVMVKITGSSSGMQSVKNHLEYISRNGEVSLETESGEVMQGREDVRDLQTQYKAAQIPQEGKKREFLHVVFSMPAGSDPKAVKEAVSSFCKEEFANRRYVMAQHDDTDHSHVHVCVQTRDKDRANEPRLNPRKDDLFRWRQGFADKLRELGLDAAASERRHRFQHQKAEHTIVRQIRADDPKSSAFNEKRADEKASKRLFNAIQSPSSAFTGPLRPARTTKVLTTLKQELQDWKKTGVRPENPYANKIEKNRLDTLTGWEAVARNLAGKTDKDSLTLATQVNELIALGQKPVVTRNQSLFDAVAQRNKNHELER